MADAKTKPTGASVEDYLASRASAEQLPDCRALLALLRRPAIARHRKVWTDLPGGRPRPGPQRPMMKLIEKERRSPGEENGYTVWSMWAGTM